MVQVVQPSPRRDGSHATLTRTYRFGEAGEPRPFRDSLETGTFLLADLPSSSRCEPSKRVHMMVLLEPTISAHDGAFQSDSLDIETVWRSGADWRRCGQMNPVQLPPGNDSPPDRGLLDARLPSRRRCPKRGRPPRPTPSVHADAESGARASCVSSVSRASLVSSENGVNRVWTSKKSTPSAFLSPPTTA